MVTPTSNPMVAGRIQPGAWLSKAKCAPSEGRSWVRVVTEVVTRWTLAGWSRGAHAFRWQYARAMFGRRRPLHQWPPSLIAKQTVACFTSDPDQLEVRAATILHQDPMHLPKSAEADPDFQPFILFCWGFTHDDRVGLYAGADPTVLGKGEGLFATREEAEASALEWVGDGYRRLPLASIPGVYQLAYMVAVTGDDLLSGSGQFMWALPAEGDEELQAIREFPPKVAPTEMTPDPAQVEFFFLPRVVVEEMQHEFGW